MTTTIAPMKKYRLTDSCPIPTWVVTVYEYEAESEAAARAQFWCDTSPMSLIKKTTSHHGENELQIEEIG